MLTYMNQLRKHTNTNNFATKRAKKEFIPLETQIQQLMASLPENMRKRDWSMIDLISRLKGKYREKPHAQKVGEALRGLGWKQYRDYSRTGGGARVWRKNFHKLP